MIFRQLHQVLVAAERAVRQRLRPLRSRQSTNREDRNWYWAAPMLLDEARDDVDVEGLLTAGDGLRARGAARARGTGSRAGTFARSVDRRAAARTSAEGSRSSTGAPRRGRPGSHRTSCTLAAASTCRPGRGRADRMGNAHSSQQGGRGSRCAHASAGGQVRGTSAAYWRDALDYCVEGALRRE